ncbi:hypothetical protein [Asaia astilbis]|nr:hypothetical protein [Asaia astilbis]
MSVQERERETGARERSGGWLRIDLDALKQNYTFLTQQVAAP